MKPWTSSRLGRVKGNKRRVLEFNQSDNEILPLASCGTEMSRKRKLDNNHGKPEGGETESRIGKEGESFQKLCQRLCPNEVKVVVEPISLKDILVTTPRKGYREVFYFSFESDSESDETDDDEEDEEKIIGRKVRFADYRLQTVQAFSSVSSHSGKQNKTDDEVHIVIPSTHDDIFKVRYARDDLHAIMEVLTGGKTSTCIIDAYIMLRLEKYEKDFYKTLQRHMQKQAAKEQLTYKFRKKENNGRTPKNSLEKLSKKPVKFQYLSVNFMPVKDRDQPVSTFTPNMKCLPDLTKLREGSNAQLIAPLYATSHLYLTVFDFKEKVVSAYDSSWHYLPRSIREGQIQVILRAVTKHQLDDGDSCKDDENRNLLTSLSDWKVNFVETSCPQYDEYSCGIYTIYYAENVIRGIAHHKNRWKLSDKRVVQIRRHIAKTLLTTTLAGRRFLEAITD